MKFLFYSSPYEYYHLNLEPLVELAVERGHEAFVRFSKKEEKGVSSVTVTSNKTDKRIPIRDLIKKKKVDAVVLVQPWWYLDREIADVCRKFKVPFYIVDHAPPMTEYTEPNGKKSHLYRANLMGARAFFAYGRETRRIMQKRGCRGNIVLAGSPRIEKMLERYHKYESKGYDKDYKACVLFDTSHRMEDKRLVKKFNSFKADLGDGWEFFVREHSRSPKLFSKSANSSTVIGDEEKIVSFADLLVFSFPSSAMILPALVGKKMIALYDTHFSRNAVGFYKKYCGSITNRAVKGEPDYGAFLNDHYHSKGSPTKRIIKYIEKDLR